MEKIVKDIQLKLYKKLKPSGWGDKLKMFILSDDFYSILSTLYVNSKNGKKFTPLLKHAFKMFEECPYEDLKVVIVVNKPYPKVNIADGIALSCATAEKIEPALKYVFKELENTAYPDGITWDQDLTRWSNQGILMLNASITSDIEHAVSHKLLWEPFMNYLFDMLNSSNSGLVYAFLGDEVKPLHKNISNMNYKFFAANPAYGNYNGRDSWDSGNLFNQINKVLLDNYGTKIKWDKDE